MSQHRVVIGLPHTGLVHPEPMIAIDRASKRHETTGVPQRLSILCHNFNKLWCDALNARERDEITHFAMIHSDINTEEFWLDTLIDEMEDHGADVMSAVIPITGDEGLTSTGVGTFGSRNVRRLTMTEIHKLPVTFGIDDTTKHRDYQKFLAVNTGLWVCDIRKSWVDDFPGFKTETGIVRHGGKRAPYVYSEDWMFSEWLAANGCKVRATRKVKVSHLGGKAFDNFYPWGTMETDENFKRLDKHA